MKKIAFVAIFLSLLCFTITASAIYAAERREIVSDTMPKELQDLLLNTVESDLLGLDEFSSKNDGVIDYRVEFFDTNHGLLVMLKRLDSAESDAVAIVFVDKEFLWYKSEAMKKILLEEMDRLLKKSSI